MISASALRIPPRSFAVFSTQRNCQWLVSRVLHASGGGGAKSFSTRHLATTAVTAAMKETDAEEFLAAESVSWSSLGISNPISTALVNAGLPRPSLVQACCTPIILSGSDVVVAAETGSGKTHGYLAPLIDRLSKTVDTSKDAAENKHQNASIVLCPNMMLCEQVAAMANSLCDDSNKPLLNTAVVSGRQGFPTKCPDILVSTPVALLNYLHSMDHERHKRNEFIHGVKYVVFDEADLLLCGSFQNQVIRLINMLRFDERLLSQSQGSVSNGQNAEPVAELDALGTEVDFPLDVAEDSDDETTSNRNTDVESNTPSQRDWRRVRKTYARSKQYIFVAATLPLNGKKTAGGTLKRMFPDAKWVNGSYLHRQNPRLEQRWVEVTVDTQVAELTKAVTSNISSHGTTRTMIFANTVDAAETIAKILRVSGIQCILYHRNISPDEQMQNISDFRENGGIFVCTDAAARGLDIPNVSHVIQAEFASSAVDFLHRVGRTARAGQHGLITSLFTESNRDLVAAVRRAEQQGLPVENAFSRKRSFRNKLKKQGKSLVQV